MADFGLADAIQEKWEDILHKVKSFSLHAVSYHDIKDSRRMDNKNI